jgi:multimeric flavodoxin WrbA
MKNVFIAYDSKTGRSRQMAEDIAEGFRVAGNQVTLKRIMDIQAAAELEGYDAYFFGGPTYFEQPTDEMKAFLFMAREADLRGKTGGAFGSYTHYGEATKIIHETMEYVFQMNMVFMGPFKVKDLVLDSKAGCVTCKDYAKAVSERM